MNGLPFYSFETSLLVDLVNLEIIFKLIDSDYLTQNNRSISFKVLL